MYEIQILNTDGKTWRTIDKAKDRKRAISIKRYYIHFFCHREKIRWKKN